jgi:hypothetical protein
VAVIAEHFVSLLCRTTQDGVVSWVLIKESGAWEGTGPPHRSNLKRITGSSAVAARRSYLVLEIVGEIYSVTWRTLGVALLSEGTLAVLVERVLPWMQSADAKKDDEIMRRLSRGLGVHSLASAERSAAEQWFKAAEAVETAFEQGAFAQGILCRCDVAQTCLTCGIVESNRCSFFAQHDKGVTFLAGKRCWMGAVSDGLVVGSALADLGT